MSFAHRRQKVLPDIRVDIDATRSATLAEERWLAHKAMTPANMNKALPPIKVENQVSEKEMRLLHELWNEAGLSARAHRRRHRGQPPTASWIPDAIPIPDVGNIPPPLPSADPSMMANTPPTTAKRRWGFRSARPFSGTQDEERKLPNALGVLRSMAQDRLKKRLRYAKSAPNLGDQTMPAGQGAQPAVPTRRRVVPKEVETCVPRTSASELAAPEAILQPDSMDQNAIYFTIDPNWRSSRGSLEFHFITPIPNSPASLGRPDSPLLHRHHSLDQLSFAAAQDTTKTFAAVAFPEEYPSDAILCQIDELHTHLELNVNVEVQTPALAPHWHCPEGKFQSFITAQLPPQ